MYMCMYVCICVCMYVYISHSYLAFTANISSIYRVSHHPYTECHIILIQSVTSSWQAKSNVKTSKRPSHESIYASI